MSVPAMTNCPNCGAPIDISRSSCEYCGTPYEKSNDIHIEVTAPDPSVEDFVEVLNRISRRSGFNLKDPDTVEYIKYNTKLERLMDTVWFWFAAAIATILCSLLPFIIF